MIKVFALIILVNINSFASKNFILEKLNDIFSNQVIYGEDNRKNLYETIDSHHLVLAESTVSLIENYKLIQTEDGNYTIQTQIFKDRYQLCEGEPFREEPTAAFCSGSLIGPNLVLTAGHCIRSQNACDGTKFMFGFGIKKLGEFPAQISSDEVYSCKKLIYSQASEADFAIVVLDREVVGHESLLLNKSTETQIGDPLVVIGHPSGLPVKIADGANVRDVSNPNFFVANLDTYGGNSGSAVFNTQTNNIEGVLVRGERDFIWQGGCRLSNRCTDEGCSGEDVTKIKHILPYLELAATE